MVNPEISKLFRCYFLACPTSHSRDQPGTPIATTFAVSSVSWSRLTGLDERAPGKLRIHSGTWHRIGEFLVQDRYSILDRPFWIFDMDGTLTMGRHDFEAIRQDLGLPAGAPILEALNAMSPTEAEPLWQILNEHEHRAAENPTSMPGALELLEALAERQVRMGIITRNMMPVAHKTLAACGFDGFFEETSILDRDSCIPKPSPEGVLHLLNVWEASPDDTVMVGDYLFDLQAGRAAGVATIHVDTTGQFPWPDMSDLCVTCLHELEVGLT